MISEKIFLMAFNVFENATQHRYFMYSQLDSNEIRVLAGRLEGAMTSLYGEYHPRYLWRFVPILNQKGIFTGQYSIVNEYHRDCFLIATGVDQNLILKRADDLQAQDNLYWLTLPMDNQSAFAVYSRNKYAVDDGEQALVIQHDNHSVTSSVYSTDCSAMQNWQLLPKYSFFSLIYQGQTGQDSLLYMNNGLVTNSLYISSGQTNSQTEFTGVEESLISISAGDGFNGEVRFAGQIESADIVWREIELDVLDNLVRDGYSPEQREAITLCIRGQLDYADPGNECFSASNSLPVLWLNCAQLEMIKTLFTISLLDQQTLEIIFSLLNSPDNQEQMEFPFYILVRVKERTGYWTHKVLDPTGVVGRLPR